MDTSTTGRATAGVARPGTPIDRSNCRGTRHGTSSAAHNHGCTCPDAKAAEARRRKHTALYGSRHAFVPAVGTIRRIRALQALGWPYAELADRLGTVTREVWRWTTYTQVRASTRDRVAALYDQLSATPGPSNASRKRAARKGWAVPLLWEGVNIDDPAARPMRDDRVGRLHLLDEVEHLLDRPIHRVDAHEHRAELEVLATRLGVDTDSIIRARQRRAQQGRAA